MAGMGKNSWAFARNLSVTSPAGPPPMTATFILDASQGEWLWGLGLGMECGSLYVDEVEKVAE